MKKKKGIRKGTVLILIGVLMLLVALGQTIININKETEAGKESEEALVKLTSLITKISQSSENSSQSASDDISEIIKEYESVEAEKNNDNKKPSANANSREDENNNPEIEITEAETEETLPEGVYFQGMYYAYIDGHDYIGTIEVPTLGMLLPVQWGWSDALMDISPCRYFGTTEENNIIIMAHNYSTHFGGIFNMEPGDEVYFTDVFGNRISYTVSYIESFHRNKIQHIYEGDWDLTLFTCVPNTYNRLAVRCKRVSS